MKLDTKGNWLLVFSESSRKCHILANDDASGIPCDRDRGAFTLLRADESDVAKALAMPNGCAWCRNAWNVISRARHEAGES